MKNPRFLNSVVALMLALMLPLGAAYGHQTDPLQVKVLKVRNKTAVNVIVTTDHGESMVLALYNKAGENIWQETPLRDGFAKTLLLNHLPKGYYTLEVKSATQTITHPLVVGNGEVFVGDPIIPLRESL